MGRDPSLWKTSEVSKTRSCQGSFRKGKNRIPLRMTVSFAFFPWECVSTIIRKKEVKRKDD